MEAEVIRKNAMIEEKIQIIEHLRHQIAELEKAKFVLNHKSIEIFNDLEPK
jgi:hypothetical protein